MLRIRLTRRGRRNQPHFRVVLAEHYRPIKGRFIEILGSYNPRSKELVVKEERVRHWLSLGAKASPTVNNLLVERKIIKAQKQKASRMKKKETSPEVDTKKES